MTDYDNYSDNLAFEPEMTWEDLVKWAQKFCAKSKIYFFEYRSMSGFEVDGLSINRDGSIFCNWSCELSKNARSYRQIQTIIEALYE